MLCIKRKTFSGLVSVLKNLCCFIPMWINHLSRNMNGGRDWWWPKDTLPSWEKRRPCGVMNLSLGITMYSASMNSSITGFPKTPLREAAHPSSKVCLIWWWFYVLLVLHSSGNPETFLMFFSWPESDFYAQLKCFINLMQPIWKLISGNIH